MQNRLLAFPRGQRGAGLVQFYLACSTVFHLNRRVGYEGQSFPERRAILGGLTLELSQGACLAIQCHTIPTS